MVEITFHYSNEDVLFTSLETVGEFYSESRGIQLSFISPWAWLDSKVTLALLSGTPENVVLYML